MISTSRKYDYYSHVAGQNFPKSLQPYYYGIHALFLEALKSREISKETSICNTRLMWWEQSLIDIEKGHKAKEPVTRVLQEAMSKTPINMNLLKRIVNYQMFDIDRGDIQTMKELEVYAENTRSMLLYLNLHLLRIDDKNALSAASHLGRCIGLCDVIKKIPFYLAKNRGYMPNELLLKHNLHFDKIWDSRREGIVQEEFFDVILEVAAYAKKHLELGREFGDKLPKHTHRAFLLSIEAEQFLKDLEAYNFNIFEEHFRKKYYLKIPFRMYRAAKNEKF
ncbi:nadh dehydrogenase complex assembly factor 6 precursor [Stylonychia lemnae]|uniref:Nadh dehydrogenase complex assembly factor 6 n=1 Tax=Stylonychia lemnae TaxID=5949 RepID=A0A078B252_STYLE|nr:nadh dehydrogenase complex assembly factor 6 precursor [Stylonychia lemnae]|eukprot:CDW87483.1 nadh dehydrogenase complex assembly factor 6 precursor [Stylonychia lemnae]